MQRKERKRNSVVSEISLSLSPSLPASVSFPSTATVEVCHLLLFPDKDGCLPLRHNGNAFTTICLCYSLKARGVLFSSDTNFIKKKKRSLTQHTHTHTHTNTESTGLLSAIFVGRLQIEVCEGSGCAHAPPVYLWTR